MRANRSTWLVALGVATALTAPAAARQAVEPAPEWPFKHFPAPPQAPRNAPNVLVVMTDDVGFAASSTFGGPVPMPHFDALARQGLRYNNFHTAAMCSPTRASLLTGRNHHNVGFGIITGLSTDDPGYNAVFPPTAATMGEVLKRNGYNTSWFGKNHNTPPHESTPVGPFDRWPNGLGFDYFYGFFGGMTNQFAPALIENRNGVRPFLGKPDYILDKHLADHAIQWIDLQHTLEPGKPFLMYYAPGTAHSPAQAPREWIEKFRGRFDAGWDKVREQIFARQKAMGVIPANARLTPRPAQLPAWSSLTPEQRRISARMMEAHAAQLAYFDEQFGRIIAELKRLGKYENTLIVYVQGDNGASQEAGPRGSNNDFASLDDNEPTWEQNGANLDDYGGPRSWGSYQAGWAFAMNTPFQWGKEVASHRGGTANGMVVSWPARIKSGGNIRPQFAHVIDIAPTIYEAIGITPPEEVNGVKQMPIDGISFAYTFKQGDAPSRHRTQYFELIGNRAYYKDGWTANTTPENMTWNHKPFLGDPYNYKWELYNLNNDYSQSENLAETYPEKLDAMRKEFDAYAKANKVYPLYADFMGRFARSSRPSLLGRRESVTYYPSDIRYSIDSSPNFVGRGWSATAKVELSQDSASGTLIAQGGWAMGWGLFMQDGKPQFFYRASDHDPDHLLTTPSPLAPGKHEIAASFASDPRPGRGGTLSLHVDGNLAATKHIERAAGFRRGETTVGMLGDEAIGPGTTLPFAFTGKLESVTVSLEAPRQ